MREPSPPRRIGRRENSKRPFYSFASLRLWEKKKNMARILHGGLKAAKAQRACPSRQIGRRESRSERIVKDLSIPLRPPRRVGLCVFARKKKYPSWRTREAAKSLPSAGFTRKKTELLQALIDCSTHLVTKVKSVGIGGTNRAYLGHKDRD